MGIRNTPYFTRYLTLKLINSKTSLQIVTNLTLLENIDQTMFIEYIPDIFRLPVWMKKQPQYKCSLRHGIFGKFYKKLPCFKNE